MRKLLTMKNIFIISAICNCFGCSTIFNGSTQSVDVKTNPPGLTARINTKQCVTPCTLENVSRKDAEEIIIAYNGVEKTYHLDKSFNFPMTILGNIWNEIWIGLIIDTISGASKTIEPISIDFATPSPLAKISEK